MMSNPISGGEIPTEPPKPTTTTPEPAKALPAAMAAQPAKPVTTAPKKEVKKFKMVEEKGEMKREIEFRAEEGADEFKIVGSGKAIGKKDAVLGKLREKDDLFEIRYLEGYSPLEIEQAIMSLEGLEILKKLQKKKIEMHFNDFKNHPHTELAAIQVQEKLGIALEQYNPVIMGWVKKASEVARPKVLPVAPTVAPAVAPEVPKEPIVPEKPAVPAAPAPEEPITPKAELPRLGGREEQENP